MLAEYEPQQLDRVFAALAHPTRRALLARLAAGEATVLELADPFHHSLATVSRHLQVLGGAGLIEQHKQGRFRRCVLRPERMRPAFDWLGEYRVFWRDSLEALASYAESLEDGPDA